MGIWDSHLTISLVIGNTLLELAILLALCMLIFLRISSLLPFSAVSSHIMGLFLTKYLLRGRAICALSFKGSFYCCSICWRKFVLFTLYCRVIGLLKTKFVLSCGCCCGIYKRSLLGLKYWSYINRKWLSFLWAADLRFSRLFGILDKFVAGF